MKILYNHKISMVFLYSIERMNQIKQKSFFDGDKWDGCE